MELDISRFISEKGYHRFSSKKNRFSKVHWATFGEEDDTWEPEGGLLSSRIILRKFLESKCLPINHIPMTNSKIKKTANRFTKVFKNVIDQ